MKTCTSCKQQKPLTEFGRHAASKDGIRPVCKVCNRLAAKKFREQNPGYTAAWIGANRDRVLEKKREWSKRNRASESARQQAWRERNRDKVRQAARARWARRKQEMSAYYREYRKKFEEKNPGLMRAWVQEYRMLKSRAMPPWANVDAIKDLYEQAAIWNGIYPECPVEVDHVVPLRGKHVCGLHVIHNLRIVAKEANRRKGNKHAP